MKNKTSRLVLYQNENSLKCPFCGNSVWIKTELSN